LFEEWRRVVVVGGVGIGIGIDGGGWCEITSLLSWRCLLKWLRECLLGLHLLMHEPILGFCWEMRCNGMRKKKSVVIVVVK
jgi:hypothetical protein